MRDYWKAIGRLSKGVFWPPSADPTLVAREVRDQGMREVIALATAAQAFRVCTGRMSYDKTVTDSALAIAETTAKAATDLKDVIGRVSTLGVGALTGVSLLGAADVGPIAAVAGGLAVWLIGNFSLNWSITRKRTKDQKVTYSFIRDYEITTLDRDLPLVIRRVRDAGLAPVFVVDELDKLGEQALEEIGNLVKRLKHLTTDYGFFCFLVNRDLYDEIDQRIEKFAYPVEQTYFSQRLLVRPDGRRLLAYLARIVKASPPSEGELARAVFAFSVMHRGKFNLADLVRAIGDLAGLEDQLRVTETELTSRKQHFVATIQVAINEALRNATTVDRMRDDSSYAQLAIDTLYYPSRCWERGATEVHATQQALKDYLKKRIASDAATAAAAETGPSDADLKSLQGLLKGLLNDLSNFPALRTKLGERRAFEDVIAVVSEEESRDLPTTVRLVDLLPTIEARASLMIAPRGTTLTYAFAYDSQAEPLQAAAEQWSDLQAARNRSLVHTAVVFDRILARVGVGIEELTAADLLPPLPSAADLAAARAEVDAAIGAETPGADVSAALDRLRRLQRALRDRKDMLGPALLLIASVSRDGGRTAGTLSRIARLVDFGAPPPAWLSEWKPPLHPLVASASAMEKWLAAIDERLLAPFVLADAVARDRYDILSERLRRHFDTGAAPLGPFRYWELVLAAGDEAPYRHLHNRAEAMLARDWSALALAAMPSQSEPAKAPYWLLIAALRGLGFGKPLLPELADPQLTDDLISQGWCLSTPTMTVERCMELTRHLAESAPAAIPGVLLIAGDADALAGAHPPSRRRPALVIGEQADIDYVAPIRWLNALGAFAGLVEEDASEDSRKPA